MLTPRFLARLEDAFPFFYERVDAEAAEDARRYLQDANGDVVRALARARLECAGRLWWPYVKGMTPVVGKDRDAMEAFTRAVLTVDHLVGHPPPSMDAARKQVVQVLENSVDVERLKRLVRSNGGAAAVGGAGIVASATALLGPIQMARSAHKWTKWLPVPARIALGAVMVAALLSIPLLAGYSAGQHAERTARGAGAGWTAGVDVNAQRP